MLHKNSFLYNFNQHKNLKINTLKTVFRFDFKDD